MTVRPRTDAAPHYAKIEHADDGSRFHVTSRQTLRINGIDIIPENGEISTELFGRPRPALITVVRRRPLGRDIDFMAARHPTTHAPAFALRTSAFLTEDQYRVQPEVSAHRRLGHWLPFLWLSISAPQAFDGREAISTLGRMTGWHTPRGTWIQRSNPREFHAWMYLTDGPVTLQFEDALLDIGFEGDKGELPLPVGRAQKYVQRAGAAMLFARGDEAVNAAAN
jgi:hypothetical protein